MKVTFRNQFRSALPYWSSLALLPLAWLGAIYGGWAILLVPVFALCFVSFLDAVTGLDETNPDPETPFDQIQWHRLITLIWGALQALTLFGIIAYITGSDHLTWWEISVIAYGLGVISGGVGIVYGHELMHQPSRIERWLGDIHMAMTLYGHYRSEHLLVHHRYVGTPRDPVTARYNENFYRFFLRVLPGSLKSSWSTEVGRLARKNLSRFHQSNPFWRYSALQIVCLSLAAFLGGWVGLIIFVYQAFIAVWLLELINYIEHYGLTRKHLGDGKYEHQKPHHSWNAANKATNWLLINLQRHSDHHHRPDRRYPLLQTYDGTEAPQLPFGYPIMGAFAMIPPIWNSKMNPKVRKWRQQHYPEITDWQPYTKGTNPAPK